MNQRFAISFVLRAVFLVLFLSTNSVDSTAQPSANTSVNGCRENAELAPPAGMINTDISLLIGCDGKVVATWQKLHELIVETCKGTAGVGAQSAQSAPQGGQRGVANSCDPSRSPAANWLFRVKKGVNGRHLTADTELAFSGVSYIKVGTGNVEVGCRCPNAGAKTISAALAASEQDPKGFIEDLQVFELVYVPRILADEATKTFEVYTVALVPAWVFQEELFDKGKPQPSAYGLPKKKATLAGERDRLEDLFTRRGASESVRDYFERQPLDGKGRYTDLQVSYFRHPFTLSRKLGNAGTTFFDDCSNFWRTVKERIESQRTVLLPDALRGTTLTSAQETAAPTGRMNRNAPRRR